MNHAPSNAFGGVHPLTPRFIPMDGYVAPPLTPPPQTIARPYLALFPNTSVSFFKVGSNAAVPAQVVFTIKNTGGSPALFGVVGSENSWVLLQAAGSAVAPSQLAATIPLNPGQETTVTMTIGPDALLLPYGLSTSEISITTTTATEGYRTGSCQVTLWRIA